MKRELDEDTYQALMDMGGEIHLMSRNYNDEVIGIEYYANFSVLTQDELIKLEELWRYKVSLCQKEKMASQWMVIQGILGISLANYIAYITGGWVGALFSITSVVAMIAMIEDQHVRLAKQNLKDAKTVYNKIALFLEKVKST
jgi:hypothetical protein